MAAAARGDRDLDRRHVMDLASSLRPPRKRDLPALGDEGLPLARKVEVAAVAPPHVLAAVVNQLELEILGGRRPVDPQRERVVLGQREVDGAMRHRVAAAARELEIEAQRARATGAFGRELHLDAVGGMLAPSSDSFEVVDPNRIPGGIRQSGPCAAEKQGGQQPSQAAPLDHPLTLPIMTPRI